MGPVEALPRAPGRGAQAGQCFHIRLPRTFSFRFLEALAGLSQADMIYGKRPLFTLATGSGREGPLKKEKEEIFLSSEVKQKLCRGLNIAFDLFCIYLRGNGIVNFFLSLTAFPNSSGRKVLMRKQRPGQIT